MADRRITIRLNLWDFGCLPGLLQKEIAATETHARVAGSRYTEEEAKMVGGYLDQLRGCIAAVNATRTTILQPWSRR